MVAVLDLDVLLLRADLLLEVVAVAGAAAAAGDDSAASSWRACLCLGDAAAEEGADDASGMVL